jgi:2-polyprenyl-6-methoxyphenol hydroxylase-like FAD-dependent oxidoreductase
MVSEEAVTDTGVLVVGAGPTGLLLAAELHRRGVPCRLIDANPGPLHWDRATVVHPRTLEIFESLGLAGKLLDVGTPQRGARIHSGGEVLGAFDLTTSGSSYPFNLGVSEEVTESVLTDYLHAQGGEVVRAARLMSLTATDDVARAEIAQDDGGHYEIEASWVVGCDGIHSPTRESTGIVLEGHDLDAPWAVFDATLPGWDDVYDLTLVYLDATPVILTALPDRRWRVYLRPTSPDSDLVADAAATLGRYAPNASFVDVENPTRFHCHSKVATRYRAGRVLLAGDAAHLCSPAQGHGMNTGLHDAANLAWKLALVHDGVADAALLDSYEAERRPIAELVAREGDDFEHAQTVTDPAERDSRDRSFRATLAEPASRHHEIVAEAELDVDCCGSPIVAGDDDDHLGPGQRIPDTIAVQLPGGGHARLHELTRHAGHTLVLLGGPRAGGGALADLLVDLRRHADSSPLVDAVVALGSEPDLPEPIGQLPFAAAEVLGVGSITLLAVRPDGYVGVRADHDHLAALERYDALVCDGHA